jgi:RsiW-degrading membrane proteinase PrsW (M82 family)
MLDLTLGFFLSFFKNLTALGILLAVLFGVIWILCFWPSLVKKPWHWAILLGSAIFTALAISFIQRPLQNFIGNAMANTWDSNTLMNMILLSAMPSILISGFVQEGAKMVPLVIYWWRKKMVIDYKLGLTLGAIAGVGFGILEAQWIHNMTFGMGWSPDLIKMKGVEALAPFIERFFVIAFHTGATALAGYGLAKGKGWQFYVIISLVHTLLNYSIIFVQMKVFSLTGVEIYVAILSLLIIGIALRLRWRKTLVADKGQ